MSYEQFTSAWNAIEDTREEAENMKLRSALMMALKNHIDRRSLTQMQAAKLFGITQPRVSDLIRGKITCSLWIRWLIWLRQQVCT